MAGKTNDIFTTKKINQTADVKLVVRCMKW